MDDTTSDASGRFVLRLRPEEHRRLREAAATAGVSLNEYCARRLGEPPPGRLHPLADVVLRRSASSTAVDPLGVVAFGSWARGTATRESDVDVLIVLPTDVPIKRNLYGGWDAEGASWDGHSVEPHYAHLPTPDRIGSLWAEAALDGIVLYDRALEVSRALGSIRRRLASGELVRRTAGGHPYWTAA